MCCSRVCIASRNPGRPSVSREMPTTRPGIRRACSCRVARNAACGPPAPIGIPNRCADPTAMSAPNSPGGVSSASASRSVAQTSSAPASCSRPANSRKSRIRPRVSGYWTSAPETSSVISPPPPGPESARSTSRIPAAPARVRSTASVCGCASVSARNTGRRPRPAARHIAIASAAAVASSSSDAPATGSPVRSAVSVWKFTSISSRPCEISDW